MRSLAKLNEGDVISINTFNSAYKTNSMSEVFILQYVYLCSFAIVEFVIVTSL